jgi:murein DD-endopeptidase MepM/ murein hydrolase activator NlpD
VSVPLPSTSLPVDVPTSLPTSGGGGGGGGNGSGSSGSGSGSGSATGDAGTAATGTAGSAATAGTKAASKAAAKRRQKKADDATPMVAGTKAAADLRDDEASPAMSAANEQFLAADEAIAEIAQRKRVMAGLKSQAVALAQVYRAIDLDVATAEGAAQKLHDRYTQLKAQWDATARNAYVTGQSDTDAGTVDGIIKALDRSGNGETRAQLRVGSVLIRRDQARADFQKVADRYNATKRELDKATAALAALAEQRNNALQAVRAAKGSDVALQHARIVESGQLGAQIRAASATLERDGSTVQGTGQFASPLQGQVTSPFGMRFHPILHYTKLHTGTDFAGGSAIHAVDDGRVLMTIASTAYGNFTVIDHGVIDGKRITTAYAHQAQFLVREGQAVTKGQQIGVVGATGYATGPHLHLEVREDGAVVDPMPWLARG